MDQETSEGFVAAFASYSLHTPHNIFVSFSTAILAVSEVSACEDILSLLVGIEIRSNAMGCMQERFTGAYV